MIEYYQKVADLWPRYGEIDSTIVHQAIVVSLINLEMTSVCLGTYPPEKGYQCWQAMKQIQASPAFERLRSRRIERCAYVFRHEQRIFVIFLRVWQKIIGKKLWRQLANRKNEKFVIK